jgi:hypothetical protein
VVWLPGRRGGGGGPTSTAIATTAAAYHYHQSPPLDMILSQHHPPFIPTALFPTNIQPEIVTSRMSFLVIQGRVFQETS